MIGKGEKLYKKTLEIISWVLLLVGVASIFVSAILQLQSIPFLLFGVFCVSISGILAHHIKEEG